MAENSHISWTDNTFNPWIGCMKVSPACDGCYAAALMGKGTGSRFERVEWGEPGKGVGERSRTAPSTWRLPRKWNKTASESPGETFVFSASLADVFDNAVDPAWRRDLFDLIRETPNLTWLLLTKRPQNIVKLFKETLNLEADQNLDAFWPPNAAIGCTVVTQEEADRDVPHLLAAKAALKPALAFLSMEPLLGLVDLTRVSTMRWPDAEVLNALTGELSGMFGEPGGLAPALDWVIVGGETDQGQHKARPALPDWYRSIRDQCAAAGVPFHFKQWGEWVSVSEAEGAGEIHKFEDGASVRRIGKFNDPCTLDGVFHRARPQVA